MHRPLIALQFLILVAISVPLHGCMLLKPERLPGEDSQSYRVGAEATSQEQDTEVVAGGPGWELTVADVERRVASLDGAAWVLLSPTERRAAVVDTLVEMETIALIAREAGLGDSPEVALRRDELLAAQWLRMNIEHGQLPTDEEVEQAWSDDVFGLRLPKRRRTFTLTLADRETLEARIEELTNLERYGGRSWFTLLSEAAAAESVWEAERQVAGDWYWVSDNDARMPEPLLEMIVERYLAGQPDIVEWEGGATAIWTTTELEATAPTLDEAAAWIREALVLEGEREAMGQTLEEIREDSPATINTELLAALAAARADEPSRAWRPRRFEPDGLFPSPAAVLGFDQVDELRGVQAAWREGELRAASAADEDPGERGGEEADEDAAEGAGEPEDAGGGDADGEQAEDTQ